MLALLDANNLQNLCVRLGPKVTYVGRMSPVLETGDRRDCEKCEREEMYESIMNVHKSFGSRWRRDFRRAIADTIRRATRDVTICSEYLDAELFRDLAVRKSVEDAADRGVSVRVLVGPSFEDGETWPLEVVHESKWVSKCKLDHSYLVVDAECVFYCPSNVLSAGPQTYVLREGAASALVLLQEFFRQVRDETVPQNSIATRA